VFSQNNTYPYPNAGADKYGLCVRPTNYTDIAIQVVRNGVSDRNFVVLGNGEVYARKYVATLNNFLDYVFQPNYALMPIFELKRYVLTHAHLPNIPSASEVEVQGMDLGELNRLLLEKIEENVLYIFQLEERLTKLEQQLGISSDTNE